MYFVVLTVARATAGSKGESKDPMSPFPKDDQRVLIAVVREKRKLMPILCIRSNAYESAPRTCIAVDNDPELLLHTVKLAATPRMQI
jgi:hypothetical protein